MCGLRCTREILRPTTHIKRHGTPRISTHSKLFTVALCPRVYVPLPIRDVRKERHHVEPLKSAPNHVVNLICRNRPTVGLRTVRPLPNTQRPTMPRLDMTRD